MRKHLSILLTTHSCVCGKSVVSLIVVLLLLQTVEACWTGPAHSLGAQRTLSKSLSSQLWQIYWNCTEHLESVPYCCNTEGMNSNLFTSPLNQSLNHLNTSFTLDKEKMWQLFLCRACNCGDKCISWLSLHPHSQAKRLLSEIVEQCRYGPGFHSDMDGNSSIQQILIPANKVGLVIGKGGETIKQLQVW